MAKKSKASPRTKSPKKHASENPSPSSPLAKAKSEKSKPTSKSSEKDLVYVSKTQATLAIDELAKFLERSKQTGTAGKPNLLEDDDELSNDAELSVVVELKKFYTKKAEFKPTLIPMAKPLVDLTSDYKTCLFLRDQLITDEEGLQKVEDAKIPTLAKILTLSQLKTVYKSFEKRRELFREYDCFVVDDAILSSMPAVLGKTFYRNVYKFPVNIKVTSTKSPKSLSLTTLANQIKKVLSSSAFLPPVGSTIISRVGSIGPQFSQNDLLANIQNVLQKFPKEQVVTVGLKTVASPILPLYYTDRIYDDSDILDESVEEKKDLNETDDDVYTQGLLELADEETVTKILGKKLKSKKNKSKKVLHKVGKVTSKA